MGEGIINQLKSVESMKEENMKVRKIAILFSGNGSNLESLIRCLHKKYFKRLGEFSLKDSQARGFLIGGIDKPGQLLRPQHTAEKASQIRNGYPYLRL